MEKKIIKICVERKKGGNISNNFLKIQIQKIMKMNPIYKIKK